MQMLLAIDDRSNEFKKPKSFSFQPGIGASPDFHKGEQQPEIFLRKPVGNVKNWTPLGQDFEHVIQTIQRITTPHH